MNFPNWFDSLWKDIRYGARSLRLNPGFTAVAVISLGLGIGANAALFQLVNALLLRTLPAADPQQLVQIQWKGASARKGYFWSPPNDFTAPLWDQLKANHAPFSGVAAWANTRFNLSPSGEVRLAAGIFVSGEFFQVLGIPASIGRVFTQQDDRRGCGSPGVVISNAFWHREFDADRSAIGRRIRLNGHAVEIVGVTAPGFSGIDVGRQFDVAVPICTEPQLGEADFLDSRGAWWLGIIGRLKPGVSVTEASAFLESISPSATQATIHPEWRADFVQDYVKNRLTAVPGGRGFSSLRGQVQAPLLLLLAIAGLVLLIACANLANLLLARASAREREIAIRLAVGASRTRLVRQLLSESLLLALFGSSLGATLAVGLSRYLLASFRTARNPWFLDLSLDWHTLAFIGALAAVACLLFGLAPALRSSRGESAGAMKGSGRGVTTKRGRFGLERMLVVAQVALSLVLLAGALLFVRSFRNLISVDTGFREDGILVASVDYNGEPIPKERRLATLHEIIDRLRAAPGVLSASNVMVVPITGGYFENGFRFAADTGSPSFNSDINRIGDRYFETMGTPLLAGRDFNRHDTAAAPTVAVVDQAFVSRFLAGRNPLGTTVYFDNGVNHPPTAFQIIGVVRNAKYEMLSKDFRPTVFIYDAQDSNPPDSATLMVRGGASLGSVVAIVRGVIETVNARFNVDFRSFPSVIHDAVRREDTMAKLASLFGLLAVVLATVGLYGVMSYQVTQRRKEIGVRIAVGANRRQILRMVFRESAVLLIGGLIAGVALAAVSSRAAGSMLFNVKPGDPWILISAAGGLTLAAILATLIPALRAARVDPMTALRDA